jgi:hypothetical protein
LVVISVYRKSLLIRKYEDKGAGIEKLAWQPATDGTVGRWSSSSSRGKTFLFFMPSRLIPKPPGLLTIRFLEPVVRSRVYGLSHMSS